MAACERCWSIAFMRARRLGGHQADHYRDLLAEHPDGHPDDEQHDTKEDDRG